MKKKWFINEYDQLVYEYNGKHVGFVFLWISMPNGNYFGKITGYNLDPLGGNSCILLGSELKESAEKIIKMADKMEMEGARP